MQGINPISCHIDMSRKKIKDYCKKIGRNLKRKFGIIDEKFRPFPQDDLIFQKWGR